MKVGGWKGWVLIALTLQGLMASGVASGDHVKNSVKSGDGVRSGDGVNSDNVNGNWMKDGDKCPPINPLPDVDPWSIRVPSAGFGGITTDQNGANKDIYLASPNQASRIGSRLNWGGSVIFFGQYDNPLSNVIDNHDTGRELQIALYDPDRIMQPCACNASCVINPDYCPGAGIPYLGWDPVQGGDKCGNGSPIDNAGQVGSDTMQVVVSPLQWNPDWEQCSCVQHDCSTLAPVPSGIVYTMEFRYVSDLVVEVMLQVDNTAGMAHAATAQEFPTVYVSYGQDGNPDLPVFLSGNGSQINIPIPADGWGQISFESPTPYVAWQNADQTYGVGLLMDQGFTEFQAWTGDGTNAPYFHNMRTLMQFEIPAYSTIRGLSYIGLGNFPTIQQEFEQVIASRPPFGIVDVPAAPYSSVHNYSQGENITVEGWVLDNMVGVEVNVYMDGVLAATLPVNAPRPDVCLMYPEYAGCPNVGYAGLVSSSGLDPACLHLMHITASDSHGNVSPLGDRIVAFS